MKYFRSQVDKKYKLAEKMSEIEWKKIKNCINIGLWDTYLERSQFQQKIF